MDKKVKLAIIGTSQDSGVPQIGCKKTCCVDRKPIYVSCLALLDTLNNKRIIFDCSPDLKHQLLLLDELDETKIYEKQYISDIFISHIHIGHYAGLINLGREAMNASKIPVYALPSVCNFIENNGPWSQLVTLKNITLKPLENGESTEISTLITVKVFKVPHRGEFSETCGFQIITKNKKIIFIPDIDSFEKLEQSPNLEECHKIEDLIFENDLLFLDATFYDASELPGRNLEEIPHPFVSASVSRFSNLPPEEKEKIYFIHLNHSNPLLDPDSEESKKIIAEGYNIAQQGVVFEI